MLGNFNFSQGLTTATASAFYIRQVFIWLWIGLMETANIPFPWKERRDEGEEKEEGKERVKVTEQKRRGERQKERCRQTR